MKHIRQENRAPKRIEQESPFLAALKAAESITTREPWREQPQEFKALEAAVGQLEPEDQISLVFRLVTKAVTEELQIQAVYAIARICRCVHIAHATNAIVGVLRNGGTVDDLRDAGLLVCKVKATDRGMRTHFVVRIGTEAFEEAIGYFKCARKEGLAQPLRLHLTTQTLNRQRKEAITAAAKGPTSSAIAVAS